MQNDSPNGTPHHHERVTPDPPVDHPTPPAPEQPANSPIPNSIPLEPKEQGVDGAVIDHPEGPPSKKRKSEGPDAPRRSSSRAVSPPWRKAGVEGPTSFVEGGRRKSSRTNAVPLDLQPPSEKRSTRGAQQQYASKGSSRKSLGASPLSQAPTRPGVNGKASGGKQIANGSPRDSKSRHISQCPAPNKAHARTRSHSSGTPSSLPGPSNVHINGSQYASRPIHPPSSPRQIKNAANGAAEADALEERAQRVPRLRFKVRKPSLGIQHPSHMVPPKKYPSFRDWLDGDGTPADESIISPADALAEAQKRQRVVNAAGPGGLLSAELCSAYVPEQQEEPSQQYSHQDHLVAHALYFKKLLDQEHRRHRHTAKLFAQWCADAYRKRNKDPEDILREQQEEVRWKRKQVSKDLQKMFDLTRAEVDRMRLSRWEEERKVEDQQALDRAIQQSTMLFEKRRAEILGEGGSDLPESSDDDDESDSESEEGESNMSSSESESDGGQEADADAGLTAEELRSKYADLPETERPPSDRMSVDAESISPEEVETPQDTPNVAADLSTEGERPQLEEVDPLLMDEDEDSTDMDDDMGDSDEDRESADAESEAGSDDGPGLLGFFSSKNAPIDQPEGDDGAITNGVEASGDENEDGEGPDEVSLVPNGVSAEAHDDIEPTVDDDTVMRDPTPEPEANDAAPDDTLFHEPESHPGVEPSEMEHEIKQNGDASSEASQGTPVTKPSEPESVSSYEVPEKPPATEPTQPEESPAPVMKTPTPHLLRGSLREYQHFGLDWLAGLYKNHINGILADEMGLGKTIQTIALLAHLALEHGSWGPHLVVVPTSVLLNWEMEFKKWCPGFKILTYYGSIEERKQKRRGWMDDTSWNVLITSYQLVLQDQQVLKRRSWHYMILDEAHNIKNFRSQKWQTLLTFRTRARLLLTGTPLQNNLTELWSLLFFLMPSDGDGTGTEGFADLRNFSEWFRRPVEQILEHGRETMDDEAKRVVTKLHTVLRPYILRRLKADVEKQMPGKYEHVVYCRLSKRQRYLYDGFMSRAKTKETLMSGNYLSIINCLMQLRKVCNHPDLFETRPISTSFAMSNSVATGYVPMESLVRRRLLAEHPLEKLDLDFLNLVPISRENISQRLADDSTKLMAYGPLQTLRERQYNRTNWQLGFDGGTILSTLESLENDYRKKRMAELERCLYFESKRHGRRPIYGTSLIAFLKADNKQHPLSNGPLRKRSLADWLSNRSSVLASMMMSIEERSQAMDGYIQRFACVTPAAIARNVTEAALTPIETRHLSMAERYPPFDPFHEAQMRLSIAFPDKRLLQYDCGKLQRLDKLLRDLKAGGHRALIFTQMTKMLDILEQFLNIHGHRYLRLDGTTKIDQRQILMDRFNNDDRILAFILSSRSGGLGINLTGADTVIFYDLDWNPAMDKQCQDRCHRIGQTRDVHIYRFVSEYTIESNILRKANQKRMLDDVVIQEGEFNTDHFTRLDAPDMGAEEPPEQQDEASAAMDRVLATRGGGGPRAFEHAEDREDIVAAKNAQKEVEQADDGDFEDRPGAVGTPMDAATPGVDSVATPVDEEEQPGHIDDYLLRFMEWNMKDAPLVVPVDKSKKKSKKGKEHRLKGRR